MLHQLLQICAHLVIPGTQQPDLVTRIIADSRRKITGTGLFHRFGQPAKPFFHATHISQDQRDRDDERPRKNNGKTLNKCSADGIH
ncbi:hypothetical protein D3C74_260490 [compost metagenome]